MTAEDQTATGDQTPAPDIRADRWYVRWFNTALQLLMSLIARLQIVVRARVRGRWRIPKEGGVIIAVNHLSEFDPPFIQGMLRFIRDDLVFMAKHTLAKAPVLGYLMKWRGDIFVERGTENAAQAATEAKAHVNAGHCLVMFPEGKCSETDETGDFKGGMADIAFSTGCPTVPVGINGTQNVVPLKRRGFLDFFRLGRKVKANIGLPIWPPSQSDDAPLADRVAYTNRVRDEIIRLKGLPPRRWFILGLIDARRERRTEQRELSA